MNNQLKTTDLENFEFESQLVANYGNGISKSLSIKTAINTSNEAFSLFIVKNHGKVVFTDLNLAKAIDVYNNTSGISEKALSPEEWLKINYNLEPMQVLRNTKNKDGWIIKSVVETDNIGHFRTNYPVVINIYNLDNETDKITIEQLFGY